MSDMRYFGRYATFRSLNKKSGAILTGADNLIGDEFEIKFEVEDGKTVAWAVNRFGDVCGYFDSQTTYLLDVTRSRGWKIHALLATVGLTNSVKNKSKEDGYYWGEMALIAFSPKYEEYAAPYIKGISENLIEGKRLDIDLVSSSIDTLIENKGNWTPSKKMPARKKKSGEAVVKSTRTISEKAIEQGRKGNIGCYIVSYAFIAVLVVGVIFLVKTLLGI